jgi:hypothetical protein
MLLWTSDGGGAELVDRLLVVGERTLGYSHADGGMEKDVLLSGKG